ncbi:chemotaxis protein CheD [Methermicoccus shengliensis]|uniref:Probable chemoreceptor glutamine deamidase CheD n=1 Tax=Methermicoccus shengliensis TaxID=660064 RepID=A0A832RS22_9EURY|nr:chemotaxis protein CheD [Methermicoccus shengliensis]KUK04653.1 MAG: putative chemoreceptor glutamine deamidase CheD [Euryarchaeota archaeon 55_53]KUK30780.1 MAG: putative chemoreceptor glutamine deamidase CheD [Methanosarcinales archeaon 56_1174]MDI3487953.1 chemotaxis protein CheD [Methanosarcinales archaeon]HIH69115.1 chemotaxis protein CheD [Methermicoccus shengliensis]
MEILVGIGEFRVAKGAVLKTVGLGSCVGIALYDPSVRVGGLAHVMLPHSSNGTARSAKYADHAVEMMLEAMERAGSGGEGIVAKIAGGAQIFKHMTLDVFKIGERNVEAIKENLENFGIRLVSEDVGGTQGRTISFFTQDGRMLIKYTNGGESWI